ncbi:MAG: selenide, water dikinase SelD [Turneriella sp.]
MTVRLTQYSHGAGCGCKISPGVLGDILKDNIAFPAANLIVGNSDRDDAAAYLLGEGQVLLSTADFFMPIVDDAAEFGRIAAANAISDIYAMGGRPIMALAILGWPIDKLPAELAGEVMRGAREVAAECGITIAGGHSIDAPEPIFGLSVNGLVPTANLRRNSTVEANDILLLTKPLGIGIHTTAMKRGALKAEHEGLAVCEMLTVNKIGARLAELKGVHAITDVTGFGLAGHLLEMITPRGLGATVEFATLPQLPGLKEYIAAGVIPGGTKRNHQSFGGRVHGIDDPLRQAIVCDPQTSGGLLVAVAESALPEVKELFSNAGITERLHAVGRVTEGESVVRMV